MAVRHGYGKVAGADALAFAYDTGDTRNSYKGEPTVNEIHTHYDVTFESLADGNTATFANQLGTGNYLGVSSTRGYNSSKSLRVNRGTGGTGRVYKTLGLTAGDNITVTAWVYSDVPGPYIHLEYFGGDYSWYVPYTKNSHQGTGWEKLYATANSSATSNTTLYYFFYPSVQNTDTYWDNVQVEKKSHPTPFVNGTRSVTQGLLDLTGNRTINLTNTSYDSNAQLSFDGSDDGMSIGTGLGLQNTSFSLEAIVKWDGNSTDTFFGYHFASAQRQSIHWRIYDTGQLRFDFFSDSINSGAGQIVANTWTHLLVTYDYNTDTCICYKNGSVLMQGSSGPFTGTDASTTAYIGSWGSPGQNFGGEIPVFKKYDRALTAAEVRNNYNNYKGRFDI
jgi:hypothetical protein